MKAIEAIKERLASMRMARKGASLDALPAVMLAFLVTAVTAVATFLALNGLSTGLTGNALKTVNNITQSIANIFSLAPTWGTLIGVGVLLVIVGGFAVGGIAAYRYGQNRGYF